MNPGTLMWGAGFSSSILDAARNSVVLKVGMPKIPTRFFFKFLFWNNRELDKVERVLQTF